MRDLIGTHRARAVLIALGALSVAALAALPLLLPHHPQQAAKPAPPPQRTMTPLPMPSGAVTLVAGTRLADGIQIGYPHTIVGAISAAAQYLGALASTLDPDYAASLGRTIGDPVNDALPRNLASSVTALRSTLQLPSSGSLPARAAFLTTPQMYQLRDASADSVVVLLLTTNTFIDARGGTAETVGVYPMRMHWAAGDWRLAGIGGAGQDYSSLSATPDTTDAEAKAWHALIAVSAGTP